jgi:hypothetical protein
MRTRRFVLTLLVLLCAGCATPLHRAAMHNDAAAIHSLLAAGVPVDELDGRSYTALHYAALYGAYDAAVALLDAGADVFAGGPNGTPREAALRARDPRLATLIETYERRRTTLGVEPPPPGAVAAPREPPPAPREIHQAARQGSVRSLEALLDAGGDPDARLAKSDDPATGGKTPLMAAVEADNLGAVRLLLRRGARVEAQNDIGMTAAAYALHYHAGEGVVEALRDAALKAKGAAPKPARPAPSSDIDAPSPRGAGRTLDYALVVGIEDYESLPKAAYGLRDARTVRRHLEALGVPPGHITLLEGPAAAGAKLRDALRRLPRGVTRDSTVFVYYAGLGTPDPVTGDPYLVPWDAEPLFLTASAYPLKELYAELAGLKARRVFVALDTCFSGAGGRSVLAKGARPLVAWTAVSVPAGLTVFAAATGGELSGTLDEQAHGIFTYHFLKGLSGARGAMDGTGVMTPRSLFDYLKPLVQDDARRQDREQTPRLLGDDASF